MGKKLETRVEVGRSCECGALVWSWGARVEVERSCGGGAPVWRWSARVEVGCSCGVERSCGRSCDKGAEKRGILALRFKPGSRAWRSGR